MQVSAEVSSDFGSSPCSPPFTYLLAPRIAAFSMNSFKRNHHRSRSSLSLIITLLTNPAVPKEYRNAVLYPDTVDRSLLELWQDEKQARLTESFAHWSTVAGGFSGHGTDLHASSVVPSTPTLPQEGDAGKQEPPQRRKRWFDIEPRPRPAVLEFTNWAYWKSRWRPSSASDAEGERMVTWAATGQEGVLDRLELRWRMFTGRVRGFFVRRGWLSEGMEDKGRRAD